MANQPRNRRYYLLGTSTKHLSTLGWRDTTTTIMGIPARVPLLRFGSSLSMTFVDRFRQLLVDRWPGHVKSTPSVTFMRSHLYREFSLSYAPGFFSTKLFPTQESTSVRKGPVATGIPKYRDLMSQAPCESEMA